MTAYRLDPDLGSERCLVCAAPLGPDLTHIGPPPESWIRLYNLPSPTVFWYGSTGLIIEAEEEPER